MYRQFGDNYALNLHVMLPLNYEYNQYTHIGCFYKTIFFADKFEIRFQVTRKNAFFTLVKRRNRQWYYYPYLK